MTVAVTKVESRGSGIVLHATPIKSLVGLRVKPVEVEIGALEAAELMRALLRAFGAGALKAFLGLK